MNQTEHNNRDKAGDRKMVDSGVEWIGEIPEGWGISKMKAVASVSPKTSLPSCGEVSFIPMEKLLFGSHLLDERKELPELGSYTKFAAGDVLVAKVTPCFENGKIAVAENLVGGVGLGSSEITPLRPFNIYNKYLMYVMSSPQFIDAGCATMNGTAGLQRVSTSFWREVEIPLPRAEEQRAIASYLDHHTSLIDRERELISAKIEALREQRKALIFECVTGKRRIVEVRHLAGVDDWSDIVCAGGMAAVPVARKDGPFVKSWRLVDSGVEWIGEIPEGWVVVPLSHVSTCNDESLPENYKKDREIKYVDISSVDYSSGITQSVEIIFGEAPSRARRLAKHGDVVISTVRTYLRAIAAVEEKHKDYVFSTGFAVLRPRPNEIHKSFLRWALLSDSFINSVEENSKGISYPAINSSELVKLKIVLPPFPEQQAIASLLDHHASLIDKKIALLVEKNNLLSDQRKSLIFEAVTGKLDIHG